MSVKSPFIERVPPQNLEAERAVLGAMLLDKGAIGRVLETLDEDCFYKEAHKKIYSVIINLYEKNEPADLITVVEELRRENCLEEVGGAAYVASLLDTVATAANVEYHARIIREKAILRNLIAAGTKIVAAGYEETDEVENILDQAEQLIFYIAQKKVGRGFVRIKDYIHDSFEAVERLYHRKVYITGVSTGFTEIDEKTAGLQPSDLIVVAARPSMGKTSLCLTIAQQVSIRDHIPVAIFSLEMSAEQLVLRMLCSEARVELHRVRTGRLEDPDWGRLTMAAGLLAEAPIFIDDSPALSVLEMRTKARRLKAECNLGLVVLDYLQLMQGRGRFESRQHEISEISRSLKALAKELKVPVIAISQLSRAVESRMERRPQLADLRESGAIEQDADMVAFIYRDSYYNPHSEKKDIAEVIIAKQRNGPTGTVELIFKKEYTRFEQLDRVRVA